MFLTPSVLSYRTSLVRFLFVFSIALLPLALEAQSATNAAKPEKELRSLEGLRTDIKGILEEPKIRDAYIGMLVMSAESGEILFEQNADKGFLPASTQKLLTTATALATLGPDFRYTTELVTNGSVVGKTLRGDLIIRGSGDPTFGSPLMFPNDEPTFIFRQWTDSLAKRGIEKIDGSIIADDGYFTSDQYPDGWSFEDIAYGFASPSSGLSFAENAVSVSVSPNTRPGSRPFVAIIPETDHIEKSNLATTTNKDGEEPITITRNLGTNTIVVKGKIKIGEPATFEQISVEEPALYAAATFRDILELSGIAVTGGTLDIEELREKVAYQKTKPVASFTSQPLSEIIKVMNKRSNNFYSEQVLRTVAKEASGTGDWEEGFKAMNSLLVAAGINTNFLSLHDGSGLSRMNLISPSDLVTLLRTMYRNTELAKPFVESLPVMGVDGTLEARLTGTPAQGNVKAKTGSMTSVRCLAGFLTTRDGETVAFAMTANNFSGTSKEINNIQDLILLRLVNFSRK